MPDERPSTTCPVCGYPDLHRPAWDGDSASDQICPSCGTQFGLDDWPARDAAERALIHATRRTEWIAAGCPWYSARPAPPGWDPARQLATAGLVDDGGT
jgi:hypothetical protein